jgi:hypothetical protein
MTSRRSDPTGMSVRFVDLPDLPETFSDSIQGFAYDGNTLRIVFSVTRLDDPKPGAAPSARQSSRSLRRRFSRLGRSGCFLAGPAMD